MCLENTFHCIRYVKSLATIMEIGIILEQLVIRNLINTFLLIKDLAMLTLLAEVILKSGT